MAQVALADSLQLPPDSTGKRTGMFKVNLAGTDVYLPASVLTDTAGNAIDSATSAPAGTERGLITRNVPSGTQPISGTVAISSAPQVAVNNVETLADNAGFTDGTSKLFPQGYVFDEVAGTGLTENDVAAARVDSKRAIVNVIEDATTRGQRAAVVPAADGLANATGQVVVDELHTYNGATWDRYHGNWRTTTGDTGAKTATFNGATQTNYDGVGAFIVVQLGTVSGTTPLLNATLQVSYDAGTSWLSVAASSPNVNTTGQTIMMMVGPTNWSLSPGATPAALTTGATSTLALNMFLPRTWRLLYTISGTTPSFTITAVHVNYVGGA